MRRGGRGEDCATLWGCIAGRGAWDAGIGFSFGRKSRVTLAGGRAHSAGEANPNLASPHPKKCGSRRREDMLESTDRTRRLRGNRTGGASRSSARLRSAAAHSVWRAQVPEDKVPVPPGKYRVGVFAEPEVHKRTKEALPAVKFPVCKALPGMTYAQTVHLVTTYPVLATFATGRRPVHHSPMVLVCYIGTDLFPRHQDGTHTEYGAGDTELL